MCGRYVVITKISEIETRFNVSAAFAFDPHYNIGPGTWAPVITDAEPGKLQLFQFGLTPFWAKQRMYLFNARSDGDHNIENDRAYTGAKGIIQKPAFRKAIRSQRCLVIADAFIEGTTAEKLSKPFLVHLAPGRRPFAFAGIWDSWIDRSTGEIVSSFAIITTTPNDVLAAIPHHRSPVILSRDQEKDWLNQEAPLSDITAMLRPFEEAGMNAYPISKDIKNPRGNTPDLIKPIGDALMATPQLRVESEIVIEGMGFSRARKRKG